MYHLVWLGGWLLLSGCPAVEPSVYQQVFRRHKTPQERAMGWLRLAPLSEQPQKSAAKKTPQERITPQRRASQCRKCAGVVSYRFHYQHHPLYTVLGRYGRSYLYDNGLMLTLLSMDRRCDEGRSLVRTLATLQSRDGSIGFSFDTWGNDFYNRSYVRTGSLAWAGYGLALFGARCASPKALRVASRIARYLETLRVRKVRDRRAGLYKGGRGKWDLDDKIFSPKYRVRSCVTEHQFDTYFFLKRLARSLGRASRRGRIYWRRAERLSRAIMKKLWRPQKKLFLVGVSQKALDPSLALDAAGTWGALFLLARGKKKLAAEVMKRVEARFAGRHFGISGYKPYAGRSRAHGGLDWDRVPTLFLEGSAGVAVVYHRLGRKQKARQIVRELLRTQRKRGGIPYALGARKNFPEVSAAASTIWTIWAMRSTQERSSMRLLWQR